MLSEAGGSENQVISDMQVINFLTRGFRCKAVHLSFGVFRWVAGARRPPLTPALSPRRGERENYRSSFFIPSPPMGERVRVRGN